MRPRDLICVGRCMVDLYCDQVGSPIDEGQSLSMYVGGCPTNVAVGAARLGLRVAMLTRVGGDGTGRFVLETLRHEGIDVSHVRPDERCLTPMVVVGIEPPDRFPIDWYRERPADLALTAEDFDGDFLGSARAVLVSGNSLSREASAATLRGLVDLARKRGTRVVYDLDFRPSLWRTPPGEALRSLLPGADLVVGTEEEYRALTGLEDADAAFAEALRLTPGAAVLKRGPQGADVAAPGSEATRIPGFPVAVLNTLGAGDAFLAGFLKPWLDGSTLEECARRGNASGALVVSRHGCAPAMPYRAEVERFLETGRVDEEIRRLHAQGALPPSPDPLFILAMDHRGWFLQRSDEAEARRFKAMAVRAARRAMDGRDLHDHLGFLLDGTLGGPAFLEAGDCWVGQPLERCGADPLDLEGPGADPALALRERPRRRAAKLLVRADPDEVDAPPLPTLLRQVQAACDAWARPLVLEVVPRRGREVAKQIEAFLGHGVHPAWWKLPLPATPEEWAPVRAAVEASPGCRGVLFLGGGEPLDDLRRRFQLVSRDPLARGFAVGRSVFGEPFEAFLKGDGEAAARAVGERFAALAEEWIRAAGC